ncbi:MAG TPA: NYN domain-containing protein [Thermoanaerobaculia bacterium]|jgi:uncharacterized LabA/DUF88 family protein
MGVTVTSRGVAAQPVTYVFVDAGHLKPNFAQVMNAWFGSPVELYVPGVRQLFKATKVFYYDSIDDVLRSGETSEQLEARVAEQEARLREINAIQNTHVRFGSVTGRDRRKRRQKEVDILIAVDMMNHAVRQNMDRAVLLTGDRDFTPLVETLVQFGLTVEVAGDFRYASDVLKAAADHFRPLGLQNYSQLVEPSLHRQLPAIPSFNGGNVPPSEIRQLAASGPCEEYQCRLIPRIPGGFYFEMTTKNHSRYTTVDGIPDLRRLTLFLELEHGEVKWLHEYIQHLSR